MCGIVKCAVHLQIGKPVRFAEIRIATRKRSWSVETPRDLAAYEKTGKYNGVYHVLHGAISPMLGIGPGDIRLKD